VQLVSGPFPSIHSRVYGKVFSGKVNKREARYPRNIGTQTDRARRFPETCFDRGDRDRDTGLVEN